MATQQATNVNTVTPTVPHMAGSVHCQILTFTFTKAYTTADVIEMGALPANCKLVDVDLLSSGIAAAATIDVGFLTGDYGDRAGARTSGNTIFAAAAKNGAASLSIAAANGIAAAGVNRGIGVKLSANEAAGPGVITLRIKYVAA